jgi:hypothetical protein
MAPYLIGQCCSDQIITPSPVSPDASGKNEVIPFSNVATLHLIWNNTRKNRFGEAAVLQVYIIGEDGKYREITCEIVPDNVIAPNYYDFDFAGVSTGIIVIT